MELAGGEVRTGSGRIFTGFIRDISDRVAAQTRANKPQEELNHGGRIWAEPNAPLGTRFVFTLPISPE